MTIKHEYNHNTDELTLWSGERYLDREMMSTSRYQIFKGLVKAYLNPEKDLVVRIVIENFTTEITTWPNQFQDIRFTAYDKYNGIDEDLDSEVFDAQSGWRYLYGKLEEHIRDMERKIDVLCTYKH